MPRGALSRIRVVVALCTQSLFLLTELSVPSVKSSAGTKGDPKARTNCRSDERTAGSPESPIWLDSKRLLLHERSQVWNLQLDYTLSGRGHSDCTLYLFRQKASGGCICSSLRLQPPLCTGLPHLRFTQRWKKSRINKSNA